MKNHKIVMNYLNSKDEEEVYLPHLWQSGKQDSDIQPVSISNLNPLKAATTHLLHHLHQILKRIGKCLSKTFPLLIPLNVNQSQSKSSR